VLFTTTPTTTNSFYGPGYCSACPTKKGPRIIWVSQYLNNHCSAFTCGPGGTSHWPTPCPSCPQVGWLACQHTILQ